MNMSALFKELGAPLHNVMWSWGAVRELDGIVFLRVWQDGTKKFRHLDGGYYTWVRDEGNEDQSHGAVERRKHVTLIESGVPAFLVMCEAEDDEAMIRTVKSFDDECLIIGGKLVVYEGSIWIKNMGKKSVREIRQKI